MICPLKFNSNTLDKDGAVLKDQCQCEEKECALWEIYTGTCSLCTDAYLKGVKASRED